MCTGGFWSNQRLRFVEHRDVPLKLNNAKVCEATRCGCLLSVENAADQHKKLHQLQSGKQNPTICSPCLCLITRHDQLRNGRVHPSFFRRRACHMNMFNHVHELHCHAQWKRIDFTSSLATASIRPARKEILNVQFNNYYYYQYYCGNCGCYDI